MAGKKEAVMQPRLKALYDNELRAKLQAELGLKNVMQVPVLQKVVVATGTGKKKEDKKYLEIAKNTIEKITGQYATARIAKKSIASFKIRKGMGGALGYMTTLRGAKMYEFVDRLINVALPHTRDFRGVSAKAFDKSGNYALGIKEQNIFTELSFEELQILHGLQVIFVIKNGSAEKSKALLAAFGMPFERDAQEKGAK
ncbi:MAG: 50S ribosomal protein L5 [Candidatus Nomurabacteria bacterium]|jgi:large subunit ribosomal protein L5|nr:50S ribosomal protein L5 [Candidatus Nomurabacteria bacterium]